MVSLTMPYRQTQEDELVILDLLIVIDALLCWNKQAFCLEGLWKTTRKGIASGEWDESSVLSTNRLSINHGIPDDNNYSNNGMSGSASIYS